jgi:hypothetical protein
MPEPSIPDISQLSRDIQRKIDDLQSSNDNETLRQELIRNARSLIFQLETPRERLARMTYFEHSLYPVTRVLVDLGIFRRLESVSPRSISATQLAEKSGADVGLLERLLKHVAVVDFIRETGPDEYVANEMTKCLASEGGEGLMKDIFLASTIHHNFPEYFKDIGYSNPLGKDKSAWYHLYKQHFFEYVFAPGHEKAAEAFHAHMKFKSFGLKWFQFPGIMQDIFESEQNFSPDQALIVDVGGSTGHDLIEFASGNPRIPGRNILQDLPQTIESIDKERLSSHGIEAMSHDFFTEQPITDAKVYYLKMVLHDWPTEQCREILSNIRPAMKPGYSRILVNEFVIPEMNAGYMDTGLDILMMAVHGAQERREREWRELIDQVEGLRLKKIWLIEGEGESIIEIERVE